MYTMKRISGDTLVYKRGEGPIIFSNLKKIYSMVELEIRAGDQFKCAGAILYFFFQILVQKSSTFSNLGIGVYNYLLVFNVR